MPARPNSYKRVTMSIPALRQKVSKSILSARSIMFTYCDFMNGSCGRFIAESFQLVYSVANIVQILGQITIFDDKKL